MPMMGPDAGNAMPVVGAAPPDRVQMTVEDHMNAVLDFLRDGVENNSLTGEDQMQVRAFMEGVTKIFEVAAMNQQQATPSIGEMNGPEVPYGSESGAAPMPSRVGEA